MGLIESIRRNKILPWLFGGMLFGFASTAILVFIGVFTRNGTQLIDPPTPVLTIIPAPSQTPTPEPSATPEVVITTPTPTSPTFRPGEIGPGQLVEIIGTGGDNLRLRSRPGLESAIAFLGVEREVFEVIDGPQELDGYLWWYLRNPYNPDKTGWAVSVYLRPIASP